MLSSGSAFAAADEPLDELLKLEKKFEAHRAAGDYLQAEPIARQMLQMAEKSFRNTAPIIAICLTDLANVYSDQGKYTEAEPLYKRSLAIREKAFGPEHPDVADNLNNLALLYMAQSKYAEAIPLSKRSLSVREKVLGAEHPAVADSLSNLAFLHLAQGDYAEAEPLYQRSLEIKERAFGPEHPSVADSLDDMAALYDDQGKYAEAEPLYKRSLKILEKALGPEHPDVADSLNNLAVLYDNQGKYAQAEPLYKRSLAIREKVLGPEHPDVAGALNNLAVLYGHQGKHAEAEPLYKRALKIYESTLGPEHPDLADSLNNLAVLYDDQDKYAEAEPLYQRSLKILEKALGPDHPSVAGGLNNLAVLYKAQGKYAEAETLCKRSLAVWEKVLGPQHPNVAGTLNNLALLAKAQGKLDTAAPLIDRAILIRDRAGVSPGDRSRSYHARAEIAWEQGRQGEAVADLREAMRLAEQQRTQTSGAEQDRAKAFADFASTFETMLAWQAELGSEGDLNEVLSAIERGRARSLLDDLTLSGADLNAGRSAIERARLRRRETELSQTVAALERKLSATKSDDPSAEKLRLETAQARQALYDHYREERSTSPVYRNLLSVAAGPPRLSQLRRQLVRDDGLLLMYLIGERGGYLLSIGPNDESKLTTLSVTETDAEVLGTDAGPLTTGRLQAVLTKADKTGVLDQLSNAKTSDKAVPKLALLWKTLIPQPLRDSLTDGTVDRLMVVPDGPLSLLPFATLVVAAGDGEPSYLLDAGPPIHYGPSASVLYNLTARRSVGHSTERASLLTVGNPLYALAQTTVNSSGDGATVEPTTDTRDTDVGGRLRQLPNSATETQWVASVFREAGVDFKQLTGAEATEANVRSNAEGCRVLHLACHGLIGHSYGNFFGALALTPGTGTDSNDDGFLTLPEIYSLNLENCDLAILSACQTNYGPRQKGEGVWALSRGFLVAGSRRVVASNWLVDDAVAASLVSEFCGDLAARGKEAHDYAKSLRIAKKWVRSQEKWKSPYYWGSFVLVGPN